jgi:WhiB family redox-sensing transcriptional regulator
LVGRSSRQEGFDMDWRFRAACRSEEPDLFFPNGSSGQALVQLAEAKSVCRRCPVLIECRTWALANGQDAGVWGGMSADERRALRRRDRVDLLLPRGQRLAPPPHEQVSVES